MIIVMPIGGLGTRLRTLRGAIQIAEEKNDSLTILWNNNCINDQGDGCRFDEVIEKLDYDDYKVIDLQLLEPKRLYLKQMHIIKLMRACYRQVLREIKVSHYKDKADAFFLPGYYQKKELDRERGHRKNVYIQNVNRQFSTSDIEVIKRNETIFFELDDIQWGDNSDYKKIVFKKSIADYVESLLPDVRSSLAGVHIRCGYDPSLRRTRDIPIEKYIEIMRNILDVDSDTMFLLSTDDEESSKIIHNEFEGHVIENRNKWENRDRFSIQNAVTDLLLLSKAEYILGSGSAFSLLSANIGNIPLIYVQHLRRLGE